MQVVGIAGFAVISKVEKESISLYQDLLGLPLKKMERYFYLDRFPGASHFGVWPLALAAQSCFGTQEWPQDLPVPSATLEFELAEVAAVEAAVEELSSRGLSFIHGARTEPWGQTLARFMSPEDILIGLSHAPWLHGQERPR